MSFSRGTAIILRTFSIVEEDTFNRMSSKIVLNTCLLHFIPANLDSLNRSFSSEVKFILKGRDRRYRAGCAPSAIGKGEVGMKGVCSLRLPQHSLVDGLVGFECRHLAASRWTPREGPNSCPTLLWL